MKMWLHLFGSLLLLTYQLLAQDGQKNFPTNGSNLSFMVRGSCLIDNGAHRILLAIKLDFKGVTNIEKNLVMPVPAAFFNHKTNQETKLYDPSSNWEYFMATNRFCGTIELTASTGGKVPLILSDVNLESAYPDYYSIQFVRTHLAGRRIWESPQALIPDDRGEATMPEFKLEDYFKVRNSGDYLLTVWPKIYKRTSANNDICERVDLPAVIIPIKWTNVFKGGTP